MWDREWQNCTTPEQAERRISTIGRALEEHKLIEIFMHFQLRTCKILEIGAGDGTFLQALKDKGFHNIQGIDQEAYRAYNNPEVQNLVKNGRIQNMRRGCNNTDLFQDDMYDIVVSRLVFDHGSYRDQKGEGVRESMLKEVHRVLKPNGLYFANEDHQKDELIQATKTIIPRANTLLRSWTTNKFIPAKSE